MTADLQYQRHNRTRFTITILVTVVLWLVISSFSPSGAHAFTGPLLSDMSQTSLAKSQQPGWPESKFDEDYMVDGQPGYMVYACRAAATAGYPSDWLNNSFGDPVYLNGAGIADGGARAAAGDGGHWIHQSREAQSCRDGEREFWGRHVSGGRVTRADDESINGAGIDWGSGYTWNVGVHQHAGQWIDYADVNSTNSAYMTAWGPTATMFPTSGMVTSSWGGTALSRQACVGNGSWFNAAGRGTKHWSWPYYEGAPNASVPGSLETNPVRGPNAVCRINTNGVVDFPNGGDDRVSYLAFGVGCTAFPGGPALYCRGDATDLVPGAAWEVTDIVGRWRNEVTTTDLDGNVTVVCDGRIVHPGLPGSTDACGDTTAQPLLWQEDEPQYAWSPQQQRYILAGTRANARDARNWEMRVRSVEMYVRDNVGPSEISISAPTANSNTEVNQMEYFDWTGGNDVSGTRKVEFWIDGTLAGPAADSRPQTVQDQWPRGDVSPCNTYTELNGSQSIANSTCDRRTNYQVRDLGHFCDHTVMMPCPGNWHADDSISGTGNHGMFVRLWNPEVSDFEAAILSDRPPRDGHSEDNRFAFDIDTLVGSSTAPTTHWVRIRITDAAGNTTTGERSFEVRPTCVTRCEEITVECEPVSGGGGGPTGTASENCENTTILPDNPVTPDTPVVPNTVSTPSPSSTCTYSDAQGYADADGVPCLFTFNTLENEEPGRLPLDPAKCITRDHVIGGESSLTPLSDRQTNQIISVTIHLNTFLDDGGAIGQQAGRSSFDLPSRNTPRYRQALGCPS